MTKKAFASKGISANLIMAMMPWSLRTIVQLQFLRQLTYQEVIRSHTFRQVPCPHYIYRLQATLKCRRHAKDHTMILDCQATLQENDLITIDSEAEEAVEEEAFYLDLEAPERYLSRVFHLV